MPENAEVCEFCRQATLITRDEEMSFHQETDRGHVSCNVKILVKVCSRCEMKTWDETAESVIEKAVRDAYDRLG